MNKYQDELWSLISKFESLISIEDGLQEEVLELLKQGLNEHEIKTHLKLSDLEWKEIRKVLLENLNFILGSRGITLYKLPKEGRAEEILALMKITIVVAYSEEDYTIEEVDSYLTFLTDGMSFKVEELCHCVDIKKEFDERILDKGESFALLLGESFSNLLREIQRDGKREQKNLSALYRYFIDEGLVRGQAFSLETQIAWYKKNVAEIIT